LTFPTPPDAPAFLRAAVEKARSRGLEAEVVSAGGTPTRWQAGELRPLVTEYRAGNYAFFDRNSVKAGAASLDDVALTVRATVVSRPQPGLALLDAGSKTLTSEAGADGAFGLVIEAPGSRVTRLNEEHAYVELAAEDKLELGQEVRVVPNHSC